MGTVTDAQLRELLSLDRIAVIGPSLQTDTSPQEVSSYLREAGYDVLQTASDETATADERQYDSLRGIDQPIDIVNVHGGVPVDEIVEGAIDREDVSVVWTHLDVRDDEAARRARDAGLIVVQDRSIAVEHRRLFG